MTVNHSTGGRPERTHPEPTACNRSATTLSEETATAPPTPRKTWLPLAAAISVGTMALMMLGLLPMLLAGVVENGRLPLSNIGLGFTLQMLATGGVGSLAGIVLKPRRLRLTASVALLTVAAMDLCLIQATGTQVLAICFVAGIAQGVLLWIAMGAIVASTTEPGRWLAILFTCAGVGQFVAAGALSAVILPGFGVSGGFALIAAIALIVIAAVPFTPDRYEQSSSASGVQTGAPPLRGWLALLASMMVCGSSTAVLVYLLPLAVHSGLAVGSARAAVSVCLAGQVIGGFLAVITASRFAYQHVLIAGSILMIAAWTIFSLNVPTWLFFVGAFIHGITPTFVAPFLMPMTIDVEPSRRTAVHVGSAILIGGALGPLPSSYLITADSFMGALLVGAAMTLLGTALALFLRYSSESSSATTHSASVN